mgnify:CR=1 FL=1
MGNLKVKISAVRTRTWVLTATILVATAFYLFVQVVWGKEVNLVDFVMLATIQVLTHCGYFPDGELFGTTGETYKANHDAYNTKATAINDGHNVGALRKYCKVEYERRVADYVRAECGAMGITETELAELQKLSPKEVAKLTRWEFDGKLFYFTKQKRRRLSALLFKKLPIEPNSVDTILSAVEKDNAKAIKDGSVAYKTRQYVARFIKAFVIGLFM